MTRNYAVKFALLVVWLICYIPFKDAFLDSERQKALLHLGELQRFDDVTAFERWDHCLSYLNQHDINCSIRVKCQTNNLSDSAFAQWLGKLERDGHLITHDDHCVCAVSEDLIGSSFPGNPAILLGSVRPMFASENSHYNNLLLSLPSPFFKDQFISLAKKSNYFVVQGDPTNWGQQQFLHFQQNIQYLLLEGIRFDNP